MDILNDTRNATPPPIPLNFTTYAAELLARFRWAELCDYHSQDCEDEPDDWAAAELAALRELALTDPAAFTRDLPQLDLDGDPMDTGYFSSAADTAALVVDILHQRVDAGYMAAADAVDDLSIECPRCDGYGCLESPAWDQRTETTYMATDPCDRCGGTGDLGLHAAGEAVGS